MCVFLAKLYFVSRSKKRNLRNRKKNQKSCRRALRKSNCNRSDHKTCHLSENTSVLEPPVVQMDTITLKDNIEDVTGNGPIVQSDICDLQKEADLTVISINDTVVDEGSNTGLDTSCFIIDVEPNQNSNETGGFYEYKNPFESGREDETEESKRPDPDSNPCAVSGDGSLQSSGISGENERFVTVCNNNDTSMDSAHLTDKSNSASGDDVSNTNDSSDASNSAVKTLNAPAVALFNNIVDRMKRDGFFGKKRKRLDNGPGNSKRYFNDSKNSPLIDKYFSDLDKSKRTKWESFKKKTDGVVGAAVSSANDPSQISRPSDQSLLRDYLNTGCICVDDSDSDVEFVEEYNPSDRLIELSDGEESVIIEEEISLPKKKRKNRKTPAKGNKQTANHYNTRQNKARLIDTGNAEKTRDSEKHVPTADCALRPIVIDGCNVGMGYSFYYFFRWKLFKDMIFLLLLLHISSNVLSLVFKLPV